MLNLSHAPPQLAMLNPEKGCRMLTVGGYDPSGAAPWQGREGLSPEDVVARNAVQCMQFFRLHTTRVSRKDLLASSWAARGKYGTWLEFVFSSKKKNKKSPTKSSASGDAIHCQYPAEVIYARYRWTACGPQASSVLVKRQTAPRTVLAQPSGQLTPDQG
jgi:hypothetical protein